MCAASAPGMALFVTMVGHKRRVRLSVEGLPCALLVRMSESGGAKLHRPTTVTNIANSSTGL